MKKIYQRLPAIIGVPILPGRSAMLSVVFAGLSLILLVPENASAQPDAEAPRPDYEVAGYDTASYHPLFIQSRDGRFRFNIGMYAQVRYNMNWRADLPDSIQHFTRGYNLARTRLFLEGDLTEKFYYHFRINVNPSGNFELFVAYLQWNINNKWNLRVGRQFMALGREDWMYPQDLASIEFSAHDFTYAIWSSFGLQVRHVVSEKFRFWLSAGNGVYGGRRAYPAPKDSDVLFTGRLEWNPTGASWGIWDDMLGRPGREFGILLGVGAGHLIRSDEEALTTDAKNGSQLNVDFSVNGNGYHLFTHGTVTMLRFREGVSDDFNNYGFYATFGYWLSRNWFPYVRYDVVSPGNQPGVEETYASPGIGISYYPFTWTNRLRVTAEYNYLGAKVNNTNVQPDGQLGVIESSYGSQQHLRFQLQFGF